MKILVTGGAGFIGGHTADALLEAGHEVVVLDNLTPPVHRDGKPSYLSPNAQLIMGDVRCKKDWERALHGVEAVFHLAAYQDYLNDFSTFFHVNTTGTALLYEVVLEKKIELHKVVVASSQAVYGEGHYKTSDGRSVYPNIRMLDQLECGHWDLSYENTPIEPQLTDESVVNPQNQYAISKFAQELLAINLGKRYSIPTVCMRYSIVQGPRQSFYNAYSGIGRIFSLANHFGQPSIIFEDGNQIRDFVNINDVVQANLLALTSPAADYEIFNVGGGKGYTVLEVAEIAAEVFGRTLNVLFPKEFRYGDTRHIISDTSKLQKLGWHSTRDVRHSLCCYRDWLRTQDAEPGIWESAYRKMRKLNVIGNVRKG